jgi:ribosomal protein S27AE
MVVRHDVNVEAIGQMAALPPDLSPLQLGARGEVDGVAFTLIGRVRLAYEEGSWNEWYAQFGDNRAGWVAEAQGFFMVSFEIAPPPGFPTAADEWTVDRATQIEQQSYTVTDRKETVCLGGEGELPFSAPPGRKATSIDLTGKEARFASLEIAENGLRLFVGRYAQFDDLKFAGLKPVPGWSEETLEPIRNETTALQCPNCGAPVVLRAAGFSMSAACGSCGSLIDTATPELALILKADKKQTIRPHIPLGRRGVLFGVTYEVIGFQHVKEEYYGWVEYLLFNPWYGFVWLVSYHGHWSFVRRLIERPELSGIGFDRSATYANFHGTSYKIFESGKAVTDFVLGEFYWKVRVGMEADVTDFVAPPQMLSREAYPQLAEETWSQGEYIQPSVLQQAFALEEALPEPMGIYLNQPNKFAVKGRQLAWLVPVLLLLLFVMQILSTSRAAYQQVLKGEFTYQAGATNLVIITPSFGIKGGRQAVECILHAPVDNNWLELDVDLVNADTHLPAANFVQGIEYYHGYDDGNWAQGRQTESHIIPNVKPGNYYFAIEPSADRAVGQMEFSVTAVRDVLVWSNFWIAVAVLLAYPCYCWLRAWLFERSRWMESDYAPALYGGKE